MDKTTTQHHNNDGGLYLTRTQWLVDHDMVDEKGRAIGGRVLIHEYVDGVNYGVGDPRTGHRFSCRVQPTRNGEDFGAIVRSTSCATMADADKLADEKIRGARARYAKLAAKR